jgi:hypothetical protein
VTEILWVIMLTVDVHQTVRMKSENHCKVTIWPQKLWNFKQKDVLSRLYFNISRKADTHNILIADKVEFEFTLKQNAVGLTIQILICSEGFATFDSSEICQELFVNASLLLKNRSIILNIKLLHLRAGIW